MTDPILFNDVSETLCDAYDWIWIWLKNGYTKEGLVEAFKDMIEEVEEKMNER